MTKAGWFPYPRCIESLISHARVGVEPGPWVKTPDAMPRQPRIDLPGVPQHLVQCCTDRRPCFFAPIDRTRYLDELRDAASRHGCAVHAHVLMTHHVHLLLTPAAIG